MIFSSATELKNFSKDVEIIKKFKLEVNFVYKDREKLFYISKNNKFKYELDKKI